MRSIVFAMAVAAIATVSTGCTMSCKFSGPCKTLSQNCTVDQCGPRCTTCKTDRGHGRLFGNGALAQMQGDCAGDCGGECGSTTCNVVKPLWNTPQTQSCDDGCANGLLGGRIKHAGGRGLWGAGLFGRAGTVAGCGDAGCGDAGCDGGCDSGCGEGAVLSDAGMPAMPAMGCGNHGCGVGGALCGGCKFRLGGGLRNAGHPYGGQVPHTMPPQGMGGAAPTPSYAYPYYTTRGPRDFLNPNPPSIGR